MRDTETAQDITALRIREDDSMIQFVKCNKCGRYIYANNPYLIVGFLTEDGRGMNLCCECLLTLDDESDEAWEKFLRENNMLEDDT